MAAKPICQIRSLSSKIEHFYDILSRYIISFQEKSQFMKNRSKYFPKYRNSETFYVKKIGENVQNRKLFHKGHLTIFTNFIDQNYLLDIVLDEKV